MKSTHVKNETEKIEFPCLMKSKTSTLIILANKAEEYSMSGICVHPNKDHEKGEYKENWS